MAQGPKAAAGQRETSAPDLEGALAVLRDKAQEFAKLAIGEKIRLMQATVGGMQSVAEAWAEAGAAARNAPSTGEEWLAGPVPTVRNLRLLSETLERIRTGQGAVSRAQLKARADGRTEVQVFPTSGLDKALFAGITVSCLMQPGLDEAAVMESAGRFYKEREPEGFVSLILGAGNVSSIPPMDALYKNMAEGSVCIVKMNPVNEWAGPFFEKAFAPFVERGYLRIVYGGAEVGRFLVEHGSVDEVHITGSNLTHDAIVWGPPGSERDRRRAQNDPILKKRITSELGNVSPVAIVPASYTKAELDFMAMNVAAMVTNNASFNCNAAKMLITAEGWPQRRLFLDRIAAALESVPTRIAYYPGAHERFERLTRGRQNVKKIGQGDTTKLPWTIVPNLDPSNPSDPAFTVEPFCALLSEVPLSANDPAEFLARATTFMNDRLWGTLNAMIVVPPALERSAEVGAALDRAIVDLRYGTVTINHWPAVVYALTAPPWGGHPSATLADVQSGIGWVHNTYLLEGVEKSVLRAPLQLFPKPAWFPNHKNVASLGRKLFAFECQPGWLKVPGVAAAALAG